MEAAGRAEARRMTIIVSKGALDAAYPPFILATMGAAMGVDVTMFFTFYGLELLRPKLDVGVSALGNPALRLPTFGGGRVGIVNMLSALPGFEGELTDHMKRMFRRTRVADLESLRALTVESGAKLIACRMTMDLLGYAESDLISGVTLGGAAAYMEEALKSRINLFV